MPEDQITAAEQFLITETEAQYSVRNIMLTNRPRGNDTAEIVTLKGSNVSLPWERERAKGATQSYADEIDAKLAQLLRHPTFLEIRALLGWYIANTMPDPAATAGQLWTVTCMPSTNRTPTGHRLLTLSCGNLETLFIVASKSVDYANDPNAFVTVNVNTASLDSHTQFRDPSGRWSIFSRGYRGEKVSSLELDLGTLLAVIDGHIEFPHFDELLAEAYTLNTRLMRRGSTMYSRFHNEKLADLLLAEAVAWEG
ncbi:GIY-YIG nuclease family protein [uncultured Corynebacterium sp.]|uniref:GIY-YIG nuclease family protein n=1 Tax=uncultured Corynebacterium sp. TaxID=159447 RepID=UPI0025E85A66|nr:GIY-YIG nuclease family protein [uncultured Corynebacterium sp.]